MSPQVRQTPFIYLLLDCQWLKSQERNISFEELERKAFEGKRICNIFGVLDSSHSVENCTQMSFEALESRASERKRHVHRRKRRRRWSDAHLDSSRVWQILRQFYGPENEYTDIADFRFGGLSKRDANYLITWLKIDQRWPANLVSLQRTHERRCQGKCSKRCTYAVVGQRDA